MIPAVDLAWQHKVIEKDFNKRLEKLFTDFNFVLGKEVFEFEEKFAEFCGAKYCVSTSSGTSALELMVRALHLPLDSEIIVPVNTFYATASAVRWAGLKVKFVDCNWEHLIDPFIIERAITSKTKAVFVVHMFGMMPCMESIKNLCDKYKLILLEDAAHAHGALDIGKPPGYYGLGAAYSFFPGKVIGSCGNGGAVTTNNKEYADEIRKMRWFGCKERNIHEILGTNSKMDTFEAIYLLEKLKHAEEWYDMRAKIVEKYYKNLLYNNKLLISQEGSHSGRDTIGRHALHQFVITIPERDKLIEKHKNEIGFNVHYPLPLNKHGAFGDNIQRFDDFKVATKFSQEMVSLPIHPGLSMDKVDFISEKVIEHVKLYS